MPDNRAKPSVRNPLAETLAAGKVGVLLVVQKATTVDIAIAAASCGFDALYVDLEHSVIAESEAAQICMMAQRVGVTGLVRVPTHDAHYANRMLDAGAMGIIAPHVESADEARAIVDACRFAPQGRRSVTYSWPQLDYRSYPDAEVRALFNAKTTVVVMLESPEAVERADEIAAVPGVDSLYIGTVDLSEALGIAGKYSDPAIERSYQRLTDACRAHGKIAGSGGLGGSPDVLKKVIRMGVRLVSAGNEWSFMMSAATRRVADVRALDVD
jgi:2-keto-3-deoxy-L-rhamnonate aldolase RhmA